MVSPTSRKIDIRSQGENRTNFPSLETEDFRWDEFLWMENERAEEGKSSRSVGVSSGQSLASVSRGSGETLEI